jgi:hypothetical protein
MGQAFSASIAAVEVAQQERWRRALLLISVFLVARAASFATIAVAAHRHHRTFVEAISNYDGTYYRLIATTGYPADLPTGPRGIDQNSTAFFPLFPKMVAALIHLGIPFTLGATIINLVAGATAILLIDVIVRSFSTARIALIAAITWTVQPAAFALSMTYSESLFVALSAGAVLALLRRRWLVAGVLTALAWTTRPSGAALALALGLVALVALISILRTKPFVLREFVRIFVSVLITPIGVIIYFAYLAHRYSHWDTWFVTERQGWDVYTDFGVDNVRTLVQYLGSPIEKPGVVLLAATVVAAIVLGVLAIRDRQPLPVLLFGLLIPLLAFSTRGALTSLPRFILPAFPLLVPFAYRVRTLPNWVLITGAVGSCAAMSAAGAYFSLWSPYPP